MASRRFRALAGATLLMSAATDAGATLTLPVILVDLAGVDPLTSDAMASEVASLLGPQVRLWWLRVEPGEGHHSKGSTLWVVLLRKRPCWGAEDGSPLATVRPSLPGRNLWVCVPNVLATAGLPQAPDVLVPAERHLLGVALGRVVVHEFVHLADPVLRHGREGLFARSLARRQLVQDEAYLEPIAREVLLQALRRWSYDDGQAASSPLSSLR